MVESLPYILGAFAWGLVKSSALGVRRSHDFFSGWGIHEAVEEVEFRFAIEDIGLRRVVKLPEWPARLVSSALFGLSHPGHELDAAAGGVLYSLAYSKGGLVASTLSHLAHNTGVYLGAR